MSNTTDALAALHAAEAELEAALAAEKVVAPESGTAADEVASAAPAVAEAPVVLGPEQIAAMKEAMSREPAGYTYKAADTPFSHGEDVPPGPDDGLESVELPKWVELPNHLGPIPINGT